MSNALKALMRGAEEKLWVDEVFSTWLYTGNGSTQTITNGIDLAGKGGMVWIKNRAPTGQAHALYDTVRGATKSLATNATTGEVTIAASLTAFNANGFSLNSTGSAVVNTFNETYTSWTFRKAPKFVDVVTYTGNGVAGRTIAHSLGQEPGMIVVKRTDGGAEGWQVYHRSLANTNYLVLNDTAAQATSVGRWNNTTPTATEFTVGNNSSVNGNTFTYVAYLFAHDTAADGLIQCGSYTGAASLTVTLGWEPQFVLLKRTNSASDWVMLDSMRGMTVGGQDPQINPNLSSAENETINTSVLSPLPTGFQFDTTNTAVNASGQSYIYLAIRRPNKPPTTGTQVYNAIARTGTGAAATVTGVGFAPDVVMSKIRSGASYNGNICSRLTDSLLITGATSVESSNLGVTDMLNDGFILDTYVAVNSGNPFIHWSFRRAPGFFDVVCDTGTGANKTVSHNLGVAPELWIRKGRSGATEWVIGSSLLANTEKIVMPSPNGKVTDATAWNSTYPTASVFSVGTGATVNTNAATYVTYLWASLAGISKVLTYTGNGTTQTINCGFSAGARFVMIIRTTASTAQDIFVWDSARGILAANDSRLSLNTNAAEVTTLDTIDPDNSGFIVNTDASNVNINGAVYIALAIA